MASKTAAKAPPKMVTIKDLENEFKLPGMRIRQAIRGTGRKAPAVETNGKFGPRAKYEWEEGSKELKEIRTLLKDVKAPVPRPKAEGEGKKSKKAEKASGKSKHETSDDEDVEEDEDVEDVEDVEEDEEEEEE